MPRILDRRRVRAGRPRHASPRLAPASFLPSFVRGTTDGAPGKACRMLRAPPNLAVDVWRGRATASERSRLPAGSARCKLTSLAGVDDWNLCRAILLSSCDDSRSMGGFKGGGHSPRTWPPASSRRRHLAPLECKKSF